MKVTQEGSNKKSNGMMAIVMGSIAVGTLYISIFVGF